MPYDTLPYMTRCNAMYSDALLAVAPVNLCVSVPNIFGEQCFANQNAGESSQVSSPHVPFFAPRVRYCLAGTLPSTHHPQASFHTDQPGFHPHRPFPLSYTILLPPHHSPFSLAHSSPHSVFVCFVCHFFMYVCLFDLFFVFFSVCLSLLCWFLFCLCLFYLCLFCLCLFYICLYVLCLCGCFYVCMSVLCLSMFYMSVYVCVCFMFVCLFYVFMSICLFCVCACFMYLTSVRVWAFFILISCHIFICEFTAMFSFLAFNIFLNKMGLPHIT